MDRLISLQAAIDAVRDRMGKGETHIGDTFIECFEMILKALPSAQPYTEEEIQKIQDLEQAELDKAYELGRQSAQPERLTDDDFETIRIHLNAYKEKLCNQQRWKEAEEYQRIINRFMSFASAQPEPLTEEEMRLLKKLRSFHSGSYAKLLDKLVASAQPEPKWIPCERELPEVGRSVLISVGGMYTAEGCLREDGDWTQFRWNAIQRKDMVGAWKPLDEPWRGEEHETTL